MIATVSLTPPAFNWLHFRKHAEFKQSDTKLEKKKLFVDKKITVTNELFH